MKLISSRKIIITAALASASVSASAQINNNSAGGYLARANRLYLNADYSGTADQARRALSLDASSVTLTYEERMQARYLECVAAYHLRGTQALPALRAFIADYPASLSCSHVALLIGNCMMEDSYAEALRQYLTINPDSLTPDLRDSLYYKTAYCYMMLGEPDKARNYFSKLLSGTDFAPAARFYTGYLDYLAGNFSDAEKMFTSVNSTTAPGNMADYYLAQIYFYRHDWQKALSTARKVLRHSDVNSEFTAEANRLAGESLYHMGDADAAIPYLRSYVQAVEVAQPSSLYVLGLSEYQNGQYTRAVETLSRVSELDDAMGQSASLYIGQALLRTDNLDGALMAFDKALHQSHDAKVQEAAFYNYAVTKYRGGNIPFGSAVDTFEEFLRRYPESTYAPDVQEYLVTGYMTENDFEGALNSINRMSHPSKKVLAAKQQVLYTLGGRALATSDAPGALKLLRQARELAAYDSAVDLETSLLMGEALYLTSDYEEARKELQRYTSARNPRNLSVGLYDLGYTEFALKNYPQARAAFEKLLEQPELNNAIAADATARIADILYYNVEIQPALEMYARAYELAPAAGDYPLFQQAMMKGLAGDNKAKQQLMLNMIAEFPGSALVPEAYLELSDCYVQAGDNNMAGEIYTRLMNDYPGTEQGRTAFLRMAMQQMNGGNNLRAEEIFRDLIRRYPTSEQARVATDYLKRTSASAGTLDEFQAFLSSVDNAPELDVAEAENLTFSAAEEAYEDRQDTSLLTTYLNSYPSGTYAPAALGYLLDSALAAADDDKAYTYASELIEKFPDNSRTENALLIAADIDYNAGRGNAALTKYRTLEEKASQAATLNAARAGLMRVSRDMGDYPAVKAAAEALLSSSTLGAEDKTEALFSRGLAAEGMGDNDAARADWSRIASLTDDLYGAKSAFYLAQNYFDNGDFASARTTVEALNGSRTPHQYWLGRGFILLSDILAQEGRNFEAAEYLRALRKNYPGQESDIFQKIDTRLSALEQ
ncbi:MAG: tetratricopeptide repeat protein [Muribaculaceae bacterium]|nr:tetratricopeptide repeat protein [Muribaculaceae bacterium]